MIDDIRLTAEWRDSAQTVADYTKSLKDFLRAVRGSHPRLDDLLMQAWKGKRFCYAPLSEELVELDDLLIETFSSRRGDFRNLDVKGKLTGQSLSQFGMGTTFNSRGGELPQQPRRVEQGGFATSMEGGSLLPFNSRKVRIDLPTDAYADMHTHEYLRELLTTVVEVCHPKHLEIGSREFRTAAYGQSFIGGPGQLGQLDCLPAWMTYLNVPGLERYLPDDIDHELLPGGGVLLYVSKQRPLADDPVATAKGKRILAVLRDLRLVQSDLTVLGWPADEEEDHYAHQITGAPAGRVYRVGLSDFSGWDPQRKVLLWTKVFPSIWNWGPSRFEYRAPHHEALDSIPPVAEAMAQLRSLELADAHNVIEWHIGREEMVEPLSALLYHHAGIDRIRLRVLYTPYLEQPKC